MYNSAAISWYIARALRPVRLEIALADIYAFSRRVTTSFEITLPLCSVPAALTGFSVQS
jgi:hypothetical protein